MPLYGKSAKGNREGPKPLPRSAGSASALRTSSWYRHRLILGPPITSKPDGLESASWTLGWPSPRAIRLLMSSWVIRTVPCPDILHAGCPHRMTPPSMAAGIRVQIPISLEADFPQRSSTFQLLPWDFEEELQETINQAIHLLRPTPFNTCNLKPHLVLAPEGP